MCPSQIKEQGTTETCENIWSICLLQWAVPRFRTHSLPFSISNDLPLVNNYSVTKFGHWNEPPEVLISTVFRFLVPLNITLWRGGGHYRLFYISTAINVPKFGHKQHRPSILCFLYSDMQFSSEVNVRVPQRTAFLCNPNAAFRSCEVPVLVLLFWFRSAVNNKINSGKLKSN